MKRSGEAKAYLVGGGIASLSAAVLLPKAALDALRTLMT